MYLMGLSTQVRHRTRRIPQGSFLGSAFISPSIVSSSFLTSTKDLKNYSQPLFSLETFLSRDHWDLLASNTDPKPRPRSVPRKFSPTCSFSSICSFVFVFSQSYLRPEILQTAPDCVSIWVLYFCCSCRRSGLLYLSLDHSMDGHLVSRMSSNIHPGTGTALSMCPEHLVWLLMPTKWAPCPPILGPLSL